MTRKIVSDILDTFHNVTCEHTGWDATICGTYSTIRDEVNAWSCESYSVADIAGGLTWLHANGPDEVGAFISKAGPGNPTTTIVGIDLADPDNMRFIDAPGSVYLMALDGEALDVSKRAVLIAGQVRWCDYKLTMEHNDVVDLSMVRGALPATGGEFRSVRRQFNVSINHGVSNINSLQQLRTSLANLVPSEMLA